MRPVTIVIAYKRGTADIMNVCLRAVGRHTDDVPTEIVVPYDSDEELDIELPRYVRALGIPVSSLGKVGSEAHAHLLDQTMESVDTEYLLTLDSDCFPVADRWLGELVEYLDHGAVCAGIGFSWASPPEELTKYPMEYEIRQLQSWNHTHVACQLVKRSFLKQNHPQTKFGAYQDTGLMIPITALEKGLDVRTWKPTRCPLPEVDFDPELNRHVCLVFADKVYHHGGASRIANSTDLVDLAGRVFAHARQRVLDEGGAEWLLDPATSYRYTLDREEEAGRFKMELMRPWLQEALKRKPRVIGPKTPW